MTIPRKKRTFDKGLVEGVVLVGTALIAIAIEKLGGIGLSTEVYGFLVAGLGFLSLTLRRIGRDQNAGS